MRISGLAAAIVFLAAAEVRAVELGPLTAQVNPKTDAIANIEQTQLSQDAGGGFAALWARFEFSGAQTQFARFFKANGKPVGKARRFDASVNGVAPDFNTLSGGVSIANGRVLAVWGAQYPDTSKLGTLLLGQVFDNGVPSGKLKRLARPDIWTFRAVQLSDGRALLAWLPRGRIDDAEAGFVNADATAAKPYVKLMGENRTAEDVAALGKGGFISAFSQISGKDEDESFAQRFDEDGRKTGGVIRLLPPQPLFVLDSLAVVGLASGGFVALGFLDNAGLTFTGDVVAQAFSRSGAKVGKLKTLAKDVPSQAVTGAAVSLPDGGFLLALEEGKPFGKLRLTFTRYDDALKPDGKVAETKPLDGLRRGSLKLLSDGRAAAIYDLQGEKVFVQVVKP